MAQTVEDYWRGLGSPTARPVSGVDLSPQIDVAEDANAVTVYVELPGVAAEEIDVTFSGGVLSICGEKEIPPQAKDQHHALREREFGRFERAVAIGPAIVDARIKTTYRQGTLTVVLPKAAPGKPTVGRRISLG
jgi:HSP20 family protein